ncbi:MAG TPA: AlpA family phage regulatory protein [Burkholderiaceae bacterium]|jgi:predicted DNA-binding transcriptional regulator AlpA
MKFEGKVSVENGSAHGALGREHGRSNSCQSLEVLHIDGALLRIETVSAATGFSVSTIYRMVKVGTFPSPVRFGLRCTRWPAGAVMEWLQHQAGRAVLIPPAGRPPAT